MSFPPTESSERRFSRLRNLPHVQVKILEGHRSQAVIVELQGRVIAEKMVTFRLGQPVSTEYHFPTQG